MKGDKGTSRPMTEKRQKILDQAFEQLRKARAKMDPKVLSSIRRVIAGSPEIMKKLGLNENLKPAEAKPEKKPVPKPKNPPKAEEGYEKIDQSKNMEVMAKLMALSPDDKEKIKSAIKKASK